MKSLIAIALSFFATLSFANTCKTLDAQYIGTVVEYSKSRVDQNIFDCTYKINFTTFNSSYVCPLDIDEVYSRTFVDQNCELKNGDFVSGVMTLNPETNEVIFE